MTYDVFISYSRKDTAIADRICAAFDRAGISYFIDRQGIAGGMEFPVVLAEAIENSRLFLFMASENSYQSKFTNNEVLYAFNEKPHNSLLPYIIDGSRMPPSLRFTFASINVRNITEHPIESVLVNDVLTLLGYDAGETALKAATCHTIEKKVSPGQGEISRSEKSDVEPDASENICVEIGGIDTDEIYQAKGYIVVGKGAEILTREDVYDDVCGKDDEYDFDERLNGGKIKIADSVKEIDEGAFEDTGIESVILPESVIKIGESAFKYCGNLSSINFPDSVKIIEDCAFENCALKSVIIPNSVESIGCQAFYFCPLESVVIPSSVKTIGDLAFCNYFCPLDTVVIPKSVKYEDGTFPEETIIVKE